MSEGKLQKLEIRAFSDVKFNSEIDGSPYVTAVNPEKYSLTYKSEYSNDQASGSSGNGPKFVRSLPEDLDLEFLFDRTGVFEDSPATDDGIAGDFEAFKKIVFDYSGDEHKPNYLKISWGDLLFPCVMTEMAIEYKLFNSNGKPIRAVAKVKFKNFIEEEKRAARENKQSPDLTHQRIVKEGDTLPLLTHQIYGDPKYYLEVAKVNQLTNFRILTPGTKLYFPPIEKQG